MIDLPKHVAAYVAATNAQDAAGIARCFIADGVVHDDGASLHGCAEIADWAEETTRRYRSTMEPVSCSEEAGQWRLRARVHGTFPGSPIILQFNFMLQDEGIQSLEVSV